MVKFIHYGTSNVGVEVVALAKEALVASLDRLRVFGSTICVDMTMLAFVDCGDHFEDHWVCEYWKADERRWVMVDPQLDALQREVLQIKFDPCDVPCGQFLPGGQAWQLCRSGQADPDHFGIFDMHGLWFVRGDMLRDLASLNKMELLPWDGWGLIERGDKDLSADDMALLDRVAALTLADNSAFAEMRALYENDARLCVPSVIKSYPGGNVQMVDLARLT